MNKEFLVFILMDVMDALRWMLTWHSMQNGVLCQFQQPYLHVVLKHWVSRRKLHCSLLCWFPILQTINQFCILMNVSWASILAYWIEIQVWPPKHLSITDFMKEVFPNIVWCYDFGFRFFRQLVFKPNYFFQEWMSLQKALGL